MDNATNELRDDMARAWLAYCHIRAVTEAKVKALNGWFANTESSTRTPSPRSDDIVIGVDFTGEEGDWYIHFRAGDEQEKLRVGRVYRDNIRRQRELRAQIIDSGIHDEVIEVIRVATRYGL